MDCIRVWSTNSFTAKSGLPTLPTRPNNRHLPHRRLHKMGLWRTVLAVVFALLVAFQYSSVETKKNKHKAKNPLQVETLQKLCHGPLSASSRKNILELQAFFDLSKVFYFKSPLISTVKCNRREHPRFWSRREWFHSVFYAKKYIGFFLPGICMLEGGDMFTSSSLFRWRNTRPWTRKSALLYALESSPWRTTGKKWINNKKNVLFFFLLGLCPWPTGLKTKIVSGIGVVKSMSTLTCGIYKTFFQFKMFNLSNEPRLVEAYFSIWSVKPWFVLS